MNSTNLRDDNLLHYDYSVDDYSGKIETDVNKTLIPEKSGDLILLRS